MVGVLGGLPISGLIFILLHLGFCNPGRSKGKQLFVGGLFGMIAFGISAAVASYVATLEVSTQSRNAFASFLAMYLVLAILAVIYVRSSPRSRKRVA